MLSIYVNGQALDLGADFSITFNFKSPVFNETGSYSYPVKIPFTSRNAAILNFKHRIENTGDPYQVFPCSILINGRSMNGLFKCTIGNKLTYEGSIYAVDGDFFYLVKDKNLQNYDFGEMIFANEDDAMDWINNCRDFDFPDRPCSFPQMGDDIYLDSYPIPDLWQRKMFNYYLWDIGLAKGFIHPEDGSGWRNVIIPFLYLKYVLKQLFKGIGYLLDNQFFDSHPDFNKLVLFNCVNANSGITGYFPYILTHLFFNYHLPFISVSDFITSIEKNWNVRFFINSTTHRVKIIALNQVVSDPGYIEFSHNILTKSVEPEERIPGYHLKMTLDDNDSDFDVMNTVESNIMDNLQGSVEKLSDLPKWPGVNPFEIRFVHETGLYYQMIYNGWQLMTDQNLLLYSQYLYKDAMVNLETKFSTLFQIDNRVHCMNKQTDWNKISPRTFFINEDTESLSWPYFGQTQTDNFSLWYKGSTGIFEKQYKTYLDWRLSTRLIKTTKQVTWSDICDIDFSKKYMMQGVKSLISSVQVTIKPNSISPSLIEHFPCP